MQENLDLAKLIQKAAFDAGFSSFYNYLETISTFLGNERQEHAESIGKINKKLASGEIESPKDSGQMPPELEYGYDQLYNISEFESILYTSFFISIYSYLERELGKHRQVLEKKNPEREKMMGRDGIDNTTTYLIKIQRINYCKNNPVWEKIKNHVRLRNCLVHNQGEIEGFDEHEALQSFVNKPNSNLRPENGYVTLNKKFCSDALDTVRSFLHSVIVGKSTTH